MQRGVLCLEDWVCLLTRAGRVVMHRPVGGTIVHQNADIMCRAVCRADAPYAASVKTIGAVQTIASIKAVRAARSSIALDALQPDRTGEVAGDVAASVRKENLH